MVDFLLSKDGNKVSNLKLETTDATFLECDLKGKKLTRSELGGFTSNSLEDISNERVENQHGFV